jgi:cytochrome c peroxidase
MLKYSGVLTGIVIFCAAFTSISYADVKAVDKKQQVQLLAPGYGDLSFEAPKVGSYQLPAIGKAKDAKVLNTDNEYVTFHDTFNKKYTVLSFMYTRCDDINGCPLTSVVFNRVKSEIAKTPELAKHMQLISMSFDPANDTPAVLKKISMGGMDHSDHEDHDMSQMNHDMEHDMQSDEAQGMQWHYLTADSLKSLMPILNDYNQDIQVQIDEKGKQTGSFSHILRVYLIDRENNIRNIYSPSFLHPDILINDIKTLMSQDNND